MRAAILRGWLTLEPPKKPRFRVSTLHSPIVWGMEFSRQLRNGAFPEIPIMSGEQTKGSPTCLLSPEGIGIVPLHRVLLLFMPHTADTPRRKCEDATRAKTGAEYVGQAGRCPPKMTAGSRAGKEGVCTYRSLQEKCPLAIVAIRKCDPPNFGHGIGNLGRRRFSPL